jgi:hypothetical protein
LGIRRSHGKSRGGERQQAEFQIIFHILL